MVKETISSLAPSVQLLTLINVDQSKPDKLLKRPSANRDWYSIAKKFKADHATPTASTSTASTSAKGAKTAGGKKVKVTGAEQKDDQDEEEDDDSENPEDLFMLNWGPETPLLASVSTPATTKFKKQHSTSKVKLEGWGDFTEWAPEGIESRLPQDSAGELVKKLYSQKLLASAEDSYSEPLLAQLATYKDFYYSSVVLGDKHEEMRKTIALHALNHVHKTRAKILKNNAFLASQTSKVPTAAAPTTRETRDQSFTRPKVLLLLPFRNSAHQWVTSLSSLLSLTPASLSRFNSEYTLPEGTIDKLANENEGDWTKDHRETFKGNVGDDFRVGLKVLRKESRLYSEFYGSDWVIGSPLGVRLGIEKDDDSDFLSSIELVIVDQGDTMLMQNWEHVNFVLDKLNKLPTETHGADMFRVKPWYLDQKATSLRQLILLSSHATPELNHLFSTSLNIRGRIKSIQNYPGVLSKIPVGVRQTWTRFDVPGGDVTGEDDARWTGFADKTLPMLLRSAVSSTQTIIFVPSYFDFVRMKKHFKTNVQEVEWAAISEYSSIPEVSRARGAFFSGKVAFLIVTERFHFFHRYKLRGALTTFFYAPPDHADYYSEFLSYPFLGQAAGKEVDPVDTRAIVMFTKFDLVRMERIVGRKDAKKMCEGVDGKFEFV